MRASQRPNKNAAELSAKNIPVITVFPGPVDTDMAAGVPMDKASPESVAKNILDGVEAGSEDIFPDPTSASFDPLWAAGGKKIEAMFKQF